MVWAVAVYTFVRPVSATAANAGQFSAIALQRPDSAPVDVARGAVFVAKTSAAQEFSVLVRNIPLGTPVDGLAIFVSIAPGDTNNFYLINSLDGGGTNGTWRLNLRSSGASAPPQLGVSDVVELTGRIVRISDAVTNVYLEAIIPPFVPSLQALSYNVRVPLVRPEVAPSANATGFIRVKLNGPKGTSVFEVRARNLNAGNSYCAWILPSFGAPTSGDCPKTENLVGGRAVFKTDTATGEQLAADALKDGLVRADQLSGLVVEVRDQFGVTHLRGVIP